MDEERKDNASMEEGAEEGEPEEGHEGGQHVEEPKAQTAPRREGGGWLSKLIWLVILALIVWGGWTAYKRGNANAPETTPSGDLAPPAPATTTTP